MSCEVSFFGWIVAAGLFGMTNMMLLFCGSENSCQGGKISLRNVAVMLL